MKPLRHFLQRSAALGLYRDILRVANHASPSIRYQIRQEARRQFEIDITNNPSPTSSQVDFLVSKGQEKLAELRKMLSLVR